MFYCQFRAGEIVMDVCTPEKLNISEPYSLFVCEGEKADFSVEFSYCNAIDAASGKMLYRGDAYDVTDDGDCIHFYYHIQGENDYYAKRIVKKSDNTVHRIFIPEKFKGKIWTRLVFSLINFDEIAAEHGASVFHASVIEHNGSAILFTAPCGTGKSTQAALWEKHRNAEIINGDKALIYENKNEFFVSGLPFSGSSDICVNKILPVKAIVRLSQAKENIISRLTGLRAYKAVFEGCYHSKWSGEYNNATSLTAERFASCVPVLSLACLPDESAVETLEKFISQL